MFHHHSGCQQIEQRKPFVMLCYHRSRETCMHEYGIFTIKVFIKLKCEIYGKPLIDVRSPEMWVSVRLKLERNETVSLTTFLHISVKSLLMGMI